MSHDATPASLYSQVSVTPASLPPTIRNEDTNELLRDVLAAQDRTNELLEELVGSLVTQQDTTGDDVDRWKESNPELAEACHRASQALGRVHAEFLTRIVVEVEESAEEMEYGDFVLSEFIDRFGPRLAHLNGVIQVLSRLGATPQDVRAKD